MRTDRAPEAPIPYELRNVNPHTPMFAVHLGTEHARRGWPRLTPYQDDTDLQLLYDCGYQLGLAKVPPRKRRTA